MQQQFKDTMKAATEKASGLAATAAEAAGQAVDTVREHIPIPPQRQEHQPGSEAEMWPKPEYIRDNYQGSGKLEGKVALITGGDSGIGRSVAVHFAREGADVFIAYLDEHEDAKETVRLVEQEGRRAIAHAFNVRNNDECVKAVEACMAGLGRLDILVNNAAIQHYRSDITEVTDEDVESTFETNILGYMYMAMAALKHIPAGGSIINTTSVTAFMGEATLLEYSATKGAIASFTRALALQQASKGIRVNQVAPGPIWTPLIPATFPRRAIMAWQTMAPMKRAGQPCEVAPCYVFLASEDSSYFTGQTLHPNGGVTATS